MIVFTNIEIFLIFTCSYASGRDKHGFDDNKIVITVAVAAFILSIRTNCKMKVVLLLCDTRLAEIWSLDADFVFLIIVGM